MAAVPALSDVEMPVFRQPKTVAIGVWRGVPSLEIRWTDTAVTHVELDAESMLRLYLDLRRVNDFD
jgi:hypothetical protein